jgi:2-keto-4-pentenoate hydratase
MMNITEIAALLLEAEEKKRPIDPLTNLFPHLTADEAYQIQLKQVEYKLENGRTIVGKKIGLTSKAMQNLLQVSEPDYGHLLDDMIVLDGENVFLDEFIQPKVEFEIAFILKKDLKGPNVTMMDVIHATEYVAPAIEIIDSRIRDWKIRFEDTVADNGSSARAIIGGKPTPIENVDLSHIGMAAYRNGQLIDTAAGAAVMGNPIHAVIWLANALSRYHISLHKGEIILSGALTAAVPVSRGDAFTVKFAHMGEVSVSFI